MNELTVADIMVPLADYARVSEDATLLEAILALEEAQKNVDTARDKHRAVLVFDKKNNIVGKLSQLDVLKGIEPNYRKIGDLSDTSLLGFSPRFIMSMLDDYGLWRKPLDGICKKAASIKVKDIMYTPGEGEFVEETTSLDEAIHQLVMGHHQSLLVTRSKTIVGVLRLTDVFKTICDGIKDCRS